MRNRYNQTFKDEAIALALDHDEPISKIAVDLGVHPHTLGNWVRKAMDKPRSRLITKPTKQDYQALEKELRKAKKELKLKEQEILVLKKATAYFAKDQV